MKNIARDLLAVILLIGVGVHGQQHINVRESFGDRLVIGVVAESEFDINPFRIETSYQKELANLIFGYGLLQKPGKHAINFNLLDRLVYDSDRHDNKVWRVVLNRNAVFHDGSLLLNSDVKFTYDLIRKYGGYIFNRRLDLSNIKEVSLEGDLEVKFELHRADPNFYEKLNDIPIISRRYYATAMQVGYDIFAEKPPMGIGPFAFEFQNKTAVNLKYHPRYLLGRPFLDDIRFELFDDEEQLIDALTNKSVDYIEIQDRITAKRLHDLMGNNIIVFTVPRPYKKVYFILANSKKFPLSELSVRRAIGLALNKEEMSRKFEINEIAHTLLDTDNPHYFKTLFRDEQYNPMLSSQILRNAGWNSNRRTGILEKGGQVLNLSLLFAKNSFFEESVARSLKISLAELNINLQPVPVLQSQKNELIKSGKYELIISSYTYDPQYLFEAVEQFYFEILKGNLADPNYHNRNIDQLISHTYRDRNVQENLFQRFQLYLSRDVPVFFLFFDQRIIIAINSRFHNFRTTYRENNRQFLRLSPFENWFVPKALQRYSTQSGDLE